VSDLATNIAARKDAEELLALIDADKMLDGDYRDAFMRRLHLESKPPEDIKEPTKPEPIARLAAYEMPFGAHKGKTLDFIDVDYLDWLCRSTEDSLAAIRAYLKHPDLESRRRGLDR